MVFFFPRRQSWRSLGEVLGRLVRVGSVYSWVFCRALDGLEVTRSVVRPRVTPRGSGDLSVDWSVSILLKSQVSSLETEFSSCCLLTFSVEWEDSVLPSCQVVPVVCLKWEQNFSP